MINYNIKNQIDIIEENSELLDILLKDRTTGHNLVFATDQYSDLRRRIFRVR